MKTLRRLLKNGRENVNQYEVVKDENMQIEIQIPKAVLFDVKYTVEQATNFAKKELHLDSI